MSLLLFLQMCTCRWTSLVEAIQMLIDSNKSSQIRCPSLDSQASAFQKTRHQFKQRIWNTGAAYLTDHRNWNIIYVGGLKLSNNCIIVICKRPVMQVRCWEEALRGWRCLWVHWGKRTPPQPDSYIHLDHRHQLGSGHSVGCCNCSHNKRHIRELMQLLILMA